MLARELILPVQADTDPNSKSISAPRSRIDDPKWREEGTEGGGKGGKTVGMSYARALSLLRTES